MKAMSRLLVAMMFAAGVTTVVLTPAVAEEKQTVQARSYGQLPPADRKAAAPGDKSKARPKVAAGTATPAGEVDPADCKAESTASSKTRAKVKQETKGAAKAKELMPAGEVVKK